MKKIRKAAYIIFGFLILTVFITVPFQDVQAKTTKQAYEFLSQGKWYSIGNAAMQNPNAKYDSRPRTRMIFGKRYAKEYIVNLDTGKYDFRRKLKYNAKMKNGQCVVTFPGENFRYVGEGNFLNHYFKFDGEWNYSGTSSLELMAK